MRESIRYLFTNADAYQILSQEGLQLIKEEWGWDNQEKKIYLAGFLDGLKKFDIFKQSRLVLHPATFDKSL